MTEDGRAFLMFLDLDSEGPVEELVGFWGWKAKRHGQYLGYPRSYYCELDPKEREDIHYIITMLANKSIFSLPKYRSSLEAAGDRIDHIHPLKFLAEVFSDEELKVGIRNIRAKGWVWHDFSCGLKEALTTEAAIHNITDEYICHFSDVLEISPELIYQTIQAQRWDEFIDTLIREIPRKGDSRRYDS